MNSADRRLPASPSKAARSGSSSRSSTAACTSPGLVGSTSTPVSPATSAVDVVAEVTTAVPLAIASNTGSPNPSARLGWAATSAPANSASRSAVGTNPSHRTDEARATDDATSAQPDGPTSTRSTPRRSNSAPSGSSDARFLRGSRVPTLMM
ncbi:MAG TPA: hypothetical protein DEG13_08750 [Candidatus Microthrix parvicella]|nr:hypothetical protein [Candidatus Microthrix parvicella]